MFRFNNGFVPTTAEIESAAQELRFLRNQSTIFWHTLEFYPETGTFHIVRFEKDSEYRHPKNCVPVSAMCGTAHEDEYAGASAIEIQDVIKKYIEEVLS